MNIDYRTNLSGALDPRRRRAEDYRPPQALRVALFALAGLAGLAFVAACAYAAYHINRMPDSVGRLADPRGWNFHFHKQLAASHAALAAVAAGLLCVALARWDRTVLLLRGAWLAAGHPMNLAIYRIVLFATILFNLDNDNGVRQIVYFAGLPKALFVPPTGMEHLLSQSWFRDLINPTTALWTYWLMNAFCVTAILGFFSRASAALVVLFGLFCTGIPQYFGQTNHFHHMFWFASICMVSRCGDYLSVDALLAARRRANAGVTAPPEPAWGYALPLRFIWVLLSICYFFPGLWKYWVSGLAWAFSDHFKHLAEWKWINMGLEMRDGAWQGGERGFRPLFRIDQYAWMYKPAAMTALIFEMGFPILIFFPRLRYLAIAMGVGFHRMIALTMNIPFFTLQTSYVSLVEWDRVFGWLGKKRAAAMEFSYDGQNASARRSVAMLRAMDLLGNVEYRDDAARDVGAQATFRGQTLTGAAALRALAARNPVLWAFWPLAYVLLPDPAKGARESASLTAGRLWSPPRVWPVALCFAIVLLPNLYLGAKRQYHGWPFACYPLFEKIRTHVKPDFDVVALGADGRPIPWDERHMMEILTRPRYATMCRRVRENQKPEQLHAFWEMLTRENPQLKGAKVVQFWVRTRLSAPEQFSTAAPVKEVLVHQAKLTPDGIIPDVRVTSVRTPGSDE
jgi:hypothetical protein